MYLSDKEKADPNYAHLKMLSFAYQPSYIGVPAMSIYGIIIEYLSDPFTSERKLLTCYDSGFTTYYSTHQGGNINGNEYRAYSEHSELSSFEQFISATNEPFPHPGIAKRAKQLLKISAE